MRPSPPEDPLFCPDCGEEIWGDTDEERRSYFEAHLPTITHQAGLLGEAGREVMRHLAEARDDALRRLGIIR